METQIVFHCAFSFTSLKIAVELDFHMLFYVFSFD